MSDNRQSAALEAAAEVDAPLRGARLGAAGRVSRTDMPFWCDASFCLPKTGWRTTYCSAPHEIKGIYCWRGRVTEPGDSAEPNSVDETFVTYESFCQNSQGSASVTLMHNPPSKDDLRSRVILK